MEYNITYSIGLVEGYLESLIKTGEAGAEEVLRHFHIVEHAYDAAIKIGVEQGIKLTEIQRNLDGYRKIDV